MSFTTEFLNEAQDFLKEVLTTAYRMQPTPVVLIPSSREIISSTRWWLVQWKDRSKVTVKRASSRKVRALEVLCQPGGRCPARLILVTPLLLLPQGRVVDVTRHYELGYSFPVNV